MSTVQQITYYRLGEISQIFAGGTPSRARKDYWSGHIPWVKTTHIQNCRIHEDSIDEKITDAGLKESSTRVAPKGSILMALIGQGKTRGQVAILELDAAINQNCVAINLQNGFDRDYVWYQCLYRYQQIRNMSNASGQQNLNAAIIKTLKLPFPSLSQQKDIGSLLKQWDTAIEKTEALITAKRKQFDWLLKKLIGDNQYNPDWLHMTLGDIGQISSAGVDKKIVLGEQKVRLLNYLDVYNRDRIYARELTHTVTAPDRKIENCSIRQRDIFFTPSSEVRNDIGQSAVAMEDIEGGVYSYHIIRLRPEIELDLTYSQFAFKSYEFYRQAYKYADGSGQRYVVSQNSFRNIQIALPPSLAAQTKIGTTLFAVQQEISVLRRLTKNYRIQKQGLMQKLLTGQWRVKGVRNV